jgi:hypothetical protein
MLDDRIGKLIGDLRAMLADAADNLPGLRDAMALCAACDEAVAWALQDLDAAFDDEHRRSSCRSISSG